MGHLRSVGPFVLLTALVTETLLGGWSSFGLDGTIFFWCDIAQTEILPPEFLLVSSSFSLCLLFLFHVRPVTWTGLRQPPVKGHIQLVWRSLLTGSVVQSTLWKLNVIRFNVLDWCRGAEYVFFFVCFSRLHPHEIKQSSTLDVQPS